MELKYIICGVFAVCFNSSIAQEGMIPETLLNDLPSTDELAIGEQLAGIYEELMGSIDINKASLQELQRVPWITQSQAKNLIKYRDLNGKFMDLYELQVVPGWDLNTIKNFLPLVKPFPNDMTGDPRSVSEKLHSLQNSYFIWRLQRLGEIAQGYRKQNGFRGSPWGMMGRLRVKKPNDFAWGFTFEKDPGEVSVWKGNQRFFDFWSFHVMLENKGLIKRLIIGDFQGQWDQGLIYGRGFNLRHRGITGGMNMHGGFYPHTAITEHSFNRGAAMEMAWSKFKLSCFFSKNQLDANNQSSTEEVLISSLVTSGLHRTSLEESKRGQLPNTALGARVGIAITKYLNLGLSTIYWNLRWPIVPRLRRYNSFHFRGSNNANIAVNLDGQGNNFLWFIQWARSKSGGNALYAGVLSSLSNQISVALKLRGFSRSFHAIYPGSVGLNAHNQNEQGLNWTVQYVPSSWWRFSASFDLHRFPWLKAQVDSPSWGTLGLLRAEYSPSKNSQLEVQWRTRFKRVNQQGLNSVINHLIHQRKYHVLIKGKWAENSMWELKGRMQWSITRESGITKGALLGLEATFRASTINTTLGVTYFDTDDFENRQFIYEKDILHSFSLPSYSGVGSSWYLLLNAKLPPLFTIWLRISQLNYLHQDFIGSGLERINGPKKTRFKFQLQIKL